MANSGVNVEFGKCFYEEGEDDDVRAKEVESETTLELESILTGNLYFAEHRKDSKHIPFMLTPYSIDMEVLINKLSKIWKKIPSPRIILFGITETEDSPSDMYRAVSRKLVKGLVYALHSTDMWLCTDGLDCGFSRDIGRAFDSETSRRKTIESSLRNIISAFPETALIGICRRDALKFSTKFDSRELVKSEENNIEGKRDINKRYDYFIFIEDASETEKRMSHFLLNFANYMNKNGANVDEAPLKTSDIPVIVLLLHGKITQIDMILGYLKHGLPVVVFEGSGGLANLIAYAYQQAIFRPEGINLAEYTEAVLKPQVSDRMHELYPEYSDYEISFLTEKIFDCIRSSKRRDQEFITVLDISKVEFQPSSLPSKLLKALFKSRSLDSLKDMVQVKKDLFFAMDWNCADVAREKFFARDATKIFRINSETFFRALTKPQREDFVCLFLNQGFVLHTYLNSLSLLSLFQNSLSREFFRAIVWENVLGLGSNVDITRNFLDSKLIFLIEELTGIPSLINSYELDWNSRSVYDDRTPQEAERKATAVLAIWAILSYRVELVKVILRHSEQPIHIALACSIILKKLEAFVTDLSLKNEMEKQSKEFSKMSVNVMSLCYENVSCRALDLLNEKNRVWSRTALIDLAAFSKNKMFIAHPCCQKYLDNIFMGHVKIRDLPYGDITIPLWLKIILSAFLIFPMYFWVRFGVSDEKKTSEDESPEESTSQEGDISSKETDEPETSSNLEEQQLKEPGFFYKLYYFWSAPITKFWVCQVFYVLFLFCFSLAVIWPACGNVFLDFFTCVWIAIIIIDSIYHAHILNMKYTSMTFYYKTIEIALMILFLFGYVMGRIISRNTFMSPYHAKVMLCVALLYFYYRLIFIALPISSELGPMLYRVKRMIAVDFVSYIRVTILVMISNGIVIHTVVFPDYPLTWELLRRAFYDAIISFFLTPAENYGSPDPKCIRLKRGSVQAAFVGYTSDCKVGRYLKYNCPNPGLWPYLFGLQYLIILRLILVVMLFAIFSNTTKILEEEGKYIWKYQRYELVINFSNRLTLPPPLSIITLTYRLFRYLFYCCCGYVLKYSKIKGFQKTYDLSVPDKLDENDYRYWKSLAMQYHKQKMQEKSAEITTKKRMERVNALAEALNKQRKALRDLEGHLNELQLQITNAHQYLEGTELQVSMRERLHAKNVPQIFSRISPYPNTMISRFPVSDNHVPWKCTWTMYDPISFTLPIEDFPSALRPHVDVDIQRKREIEGESFRMPNFNWNKITVSAGGVTFDRQSWIADKQYELDSEDLPKNPCGRTGLKGRGCLPRWGPNHYIYVVITRWHEKEELFHNYLDVILMSTGDYFSLPGGYVHAENRYEIIQSLFVTEETWKGSKDMIYYFESLKVTGVRGRKASIWQRMAKVKSAEVLEDDFTVEKVKLGYMDEETNTDQAWCEAEVWHLHYNILSNIDENFKTYMEWHVLSEENLLKVPVGQAAIMYSVAKKMKAILEVI